MSKVEESITTDSNAIPSDPSPEKKVESFATEGGLSSKTHFPDSGTQEHFVPFAIADVPEPERFAVEKIRTSRRLFIPTATTSYSISTVLRTEAKLFDKYEMYSVESLNITFLDAVNYLTDNTIIKVYYNTDPMRKDDAQPAAQLKTSHNQDTNFWGDTAELRHNGIAIFRKSELTSVKIPVQSGWVYTTGGVDSRMDDLGTLYIEICGGFDSHLLPTPSITFTATMKYKIPTILVTTDEIHTYVDEDWLFGKTFYLNARSEDRIDLIFSGDPEFTGKQLTFLNQITITGEAPITEDGTTESGTVPFALTFTTAFSKLGDAEGYYSVPTTFSAPLLLDAQDQCELDNAEAITGEGGPYWRMEIADASRRTITPL